MMPQGTNGYLGQVLLKYKYQDQTKRDVNSAVAQYKNLSAKRDTYVFNDGSRKELACLDGTVPVQYKGSCYHIPICIWLLDTHPYNSPMCYVKPTSEMQIKPSRHVDSNGRIYLPYLHDWQPNGSDLLGLIQVMICVFGETPPVYSKPKVQGGANFTPPYPVSQPSGYMPLPGVGTPYPPYNSGWGGPTPYQAPYPQQQQQPPQTGYPPRYDFSGYNAAGATTANSYPPSSGAPGYNMPTSTPNPVQPQNSTGTISEEHIHASLLSAVEHKLKEKLSESLSQSQAEIEVLKRTQDDLTKGKSKLDDIIRLLQKEEGDLEKTLTILKTKDEEMSDLITKMEHQEEFNIDDAVITTAPLYKQLLNTFAEENATEDAIYYLGEALRKGVIDLDTFLKHVRHLSRNQFMLRSLMQKCRQKANLPH